MFKYTILLALYLPAIALGMSDEMMELAAQLRETCVAETGVGVDLLDKINADKKWSDDEKFKCYLNCLMVQMGCISDDGVVDPEAVLALIPEESKAEATPVIKSCGAKSGATPCDSAWLTQKCYFESKPDAYQVI